MLLLTNGLTKWKDALTITRPLYQLPSPSMPATSEDIVIGFGTNSSGNTLFFMNGVSFRGNYNAPVLLLAKLGNTSYPNDPEWNVYNYGTNSSVRIIVYNESPLAHPMHLHGHNFWVLAEGNGTWNGAVTNPLNPQRRDTQLVQAGTPDSPAYIVIEFLANNPGVWPLHCHISW